MRALFTPFLWKKALEAGEKTRQMGNLTIDQQN